jgi:hypothetical protein
MRQRVDRTLFGDFLKDISRETEPFYADAKDDYGFRSPVGQLFPDRNPHGPLPKPVLRRLAV